MEKEHNAGAKMLTQLVRAVPLMGKRRIRDWSMKDTFHYLHFYIKNWIIGLFWNILYSKHFKEEAYFGDLVVTKMGHKEALAPFLCTLRSSTDQMRTERRSEDSLWVSVVKEGVVLKEDWRRTWSQINGEGSGIHGVHTTFRGGFRKGMETRMKPGGRLGTVCGGTSNAKLRTLGFILRNICWAPIHCSVPH